MGGRARAMVSVKMLIEAGLLAPGQTLHVKAGPDTMRGVLGEDGRIRFDGGEFASLSAFAQRALCKAGRQRKAAAGWNEVKLDNGRPIDDVRREYMKQVDGGRIDAAYQQGLEWAQEPNSAGIQWREAQRAIDAHNKLERTLRPRRPKVSLEERQQGQGRSDRHNRDGMGLTPDHATSKSRGHTDGGLRGRRKARRAERERRHCAIASLAEAAILVEGGAISGAQLKELSCQSALGAYEAVQEAKPSVRCEKVAAEITTALQDFIQYSRKRGKQMDSLPENERWKRGRVDQLPMDRDKVKNSTKLTYPEETTNYAGVGGPNNHQVPPEVWTSLGNGHLARGVEMHTAGVEKGKIIPLCQNKLSSEGSSVHPACVAGSDSMVQGAWLSTTGGNDQLRNDTEDMVQMGLSGECSSRTGIHNRNPDSQSGEVSEVAGAGLMVGDNASATPAPLEKNSRLQVSVCEHMARNEEALLTREDGYSYGEWMARCSSSFLAERASDVLGAVTLESFMGCVGEKERQQLIELLPECDKEALQQHRNPFNKNVFKTQVLHYHALLGRGLLERDANTFWVPAHGCTKDSKDRRTKALERLAAYVSPEALEAVQQGLMTAPDALLGFQVDEEREKAGRAPKSRDKE